MSRPESVWDYPRPPRVEPSHELVTVQLGGIVVCQTRLSLRVLETSHPPTYYLPFGDWLEGSLQPAPGRSFCEFKGYATYWTVVAGPVRAEGAAWSYPEPSAGFEAVRDHVAVYPARMEQCTVDGEPVRPQEGGFYGGWITDRVVGPFKGAPGTRGW